MKNIGDVLIAEEGNTEIVMGNYAIVRAMIESGVRVVSSYPGSPTPEIANAIETLPKDRNPLYFEFSVNEKVATEVAFGASINGHLSCVFFKSVGLNVASDSLIQLGLMNLIGGLVIIIGDDPGANSSQNEQDNRHFAKMAYIPMFEPASPTEAYLMFKEAAALSKERQMPIFLRMTTHVCHAKERVYFDSYKKHIIDNQPLFSIDNGPYIPITNAVFPLKHRALMKLDSMQKYAEDCVFNKVLRFGHKKYGIITAGLPYLSLMDVLEKSIVKPDILKLGLVHPLPASRIIEFLSSHSEVKILEELDDVIEQKVKAIAYENNMQTKIIGKQEIDEWINEYTIDKVEHILRGCWKQIFKEEESKIQTQAISNRPAQLCPGCGHRSAFYAIKQAINDSTISVADIGCHTLGFLPPYEIGQSLLSMGHSNGTAAGLSLFNTERKVICFLGDSTFFHAGIPGIINAVFNKHKHTLIIMENGTTAMTGHQDHPAVGKNFNEITDKIPVQRVLEALGVKHIWEIDTYQQEKLTIAIKEAMEIDEFSVVIAKHPCMLKFTKESKKKGFSKQTPISVSSKCNKSYLCVSQFACPSFQIAEDGHVWVQKDLCIGDGSCKPTCPQNALEKAKTEEQYNDQQ